MEALVFSLWIIALVIVGGLVINRRVFGRRGNPPVDAAWLLQSDTATDLQVELAVRYLDRVRVHRALGGIIGTTLAVAHGLVAERQVSIATTTSSPAGDLLFGGLTGLLIGSVMADTWRISRRGSRRQASLEVRQVEEGARTLWPVVAGFTVSTIVLVIGNVTVRSVGVAATAVAVLAVHVRVLRAIAERGRPALPDDLLVADDAIRAFASRRIAIETSAAATLLFAWQLAGATLPYPDLMVELATWAAVIATVVMIRRSRPWPPRRFDGSIKTVVG